MQSIQINGKQRVLGCLPRVSAQGDGAFEMLGDDWLIPRDEWKKYEDISHEELIWHVLNQAKQGSCCGCATVGAQMLMREYMGLDRIVLSQASVYALGNGGSDSGMAIDTGLSILLKYGACPVSIIEQYNWHGYRRGTWPDDWEEHSARMKGLEWRDIPANGSAPPFDYMMSGMWRGGIPVYGAKGHAVVRVHKRKDLNSWDYDWGDNGVGEWATEREINNSVASYGAWLLCATTDPTNDGDL